MLDIPTAKRAGTRTPGQREVGQPGPGMTSLGEQPEPWTGPAVSDWNQQYGATAEKQATGWKDPIAQQVTKDFYQGYGEPGMDEYNRLMRDAPMYESGKYGGYMSPLDPMGFNQPGLKEAYIKAGGQAYEQPPMAPGMALPGQPYIAGTGMAAPVMNSAGVSVNPNTGEPMTGSGSQHSLNPSVINRMWR